MVSKEIGLEPAIQMEWTYSLKPQRSSNSHRFLFLSLLISPSSLQRSKILILNTRVSGTNGHLILSPESPDRQLSLFSLLISPSKLSSFELPFTSDILQRSETPFYKALKYLTHLQLRSLSVLCLISKFLQRSLLLFVPPSSQTPSISSSSSSNID